jgi:exosome complex exonuclease RRP6
VKDLRARCGALLDAFGVDGAKDGATDPELATRCDYDDDLCQSVVAVVDDHLDAVDHQLAEAHVAGAGGYTGPAARGSAASALGRDANKGTKNAGARNSFVSRRPQDSFDVPIDNSNVPFMPPVPVNHPDPSSYVPSAGTHPLREELDDLIYPSSVRAPPSSPIAPAPTSSTVCEFIDTPEALEDMAHHLSSVDEIAVDLEHHSFRSFQGFTCTVQVSTRRRDFVVDALALRTEIRAALGPCMADAGKLKVFHGADMDVQWLQRDFGIYIVGMFDTGQAARVLELPRKGLAYLLDHYCGIKADKRFQLADWRIRPLSDAMIEYARGDTHHLLYVYDRLRQQLEATGLGDGSRPRVDLIKTTLDRSRDVCATLYDKPVTDQLTYHVDYRKNRDAGDLDLPRLAVYAALHSWRDKTSRTEDESIGYVMPRALMLRLAREAPTTPRSLLAVTRGDSPLVAKHSGEIVDLIARAMAAGTPPALPPTGWGGIRQISRGKET